MNFRKLSAVLLIFALFLSGCAEKTESRDVLSIWCLDSEPLRGPMERLTEEYNRNLPKGSLPARLRSFPDEEALASGFDTMRPDILICSDIRGEALAAQGSARSMAEALWDKAPEYPEYISSRIPAAGSEYFPIGGSIQLICGETEALRDVSGLGEFLKKAAEYGEIERLPFMAADSYSSVFYQCLLADGKEFHAFKLRDMKNPAYTEIYNLLSEAAFTGGLLSSEISAQSLLESKSVPCALLPSSSLASADLRGLAFMPLEGLEESKNLLSSLSGLAVTVREGRDIFSASEFLKWLFEPGRAAELALSAGLVPLTEISESGNENPLKNLLVRAAESSLLHLPEAGCDWLKNREDFELSFRRTLNILD